MTITDKQIDVIAYRLQNGMDIHEALAILPNTYLLCKNCRFWEEESKICHKFNEELYETGSGVAPSYDDSNIHTGPNFGCIHFEVKNG